MSLRSCSQEKAQAEAKSNARLALVLAIGKLQQELGPDRRISAKADEVSNPHYLGMWESWNTRLTDKKGPLAI